MKTIPDLIEQAKNVSTPLIAVSTADPQATQDAIAKRLQAFPLLSWDIARGAIAVNELGKKAAPALGRDLSEITTPGEALILAAKLPADTVLFIHMAHQYLDNEQVKQAIWNLRDIFKSNGRTLILFGPSFTLPAELAQDVLLLDEPLPTEAELSAIVTAQYENARQTNDPPMTKEAFPDPDEKELGRIVDACRGLAAYPSEQAVAMALRKTGIDLDDLWIRKKTFINQIRALRVEESTLTFADVGGLLTMKAYLGSLAAGPLSPIVWLWIDEIEKLFAGAGSLGDSSGVSQDQLATFLTLFQLYGWTGTLAVGHPGCQPQGSKVLMANGDWQTIDSIKVGDLVMSPDSPGGPVRPIKVVATHIYAPCQIYKVKMDEHHSYLCSYNHIIPHWANTKRRPKEGRRYQQTIYREKSVVNILNHGKGYQRKCRIFTTPAIDRPEADLLIHPYILGCWVGDGGWSPSHASPLITSGDPPLIDELRKLGAELGPPKNKSGTEAKGYAVRLPLAKKLEVLGYRGCKADSKFIPAIYKAASLNQRLELLAGLIDTDGDKESYTTISPQLAQDFMELIHSVGGYATSRQRVQFIKAIGREYRSYRIQYSTTERAIPVRLERKRQPIRNMKWKNPRNRRAKFEPVGVAAVYGITLAEGSQCYITDNWMITHNTGKSLIAKTAAKTYSGVCVAFDTGAAKGSLVGESEKYIRAAFKAVQAIGGNRVHVIATCNGLDSLKPEMRRRFGTPWVFDLPTKEERATIWPISIKRFNLNEAEPRPEDEGWTGAEVNKCCELAYMLQKPLSEAACYVIPIIKSDPEAIKKLRDQASNRWLSASYPGPYRPETEKIADGGRKIKL